MAPENPWRRYLQLLAATAGGVLAGCSSLAGSEPGGPTETEPAAIDDWQYDPDGTPTSSYWWPSGPHRWLGMKTASPSRPRTTGRIRRFRRHFQAEADALGDDSLDRELDVLDRVLAATPAFDRGTRATSVRADIDTSGVPHPAMDDEESSPVGVSIRPVEGPDEWLLTFSETLIRYVEVAAALLLVLLFGIGVFDLGLQILASAVSGGITDPLVVVGFIDTALLLFIIVEVYHTVVAYIRESDTRRIVRLVVYTGAIAMVRKAIIFRTGEYADEQAALLAAGSYTLLIIGLAALLLVERRTRAGTS